MKNYDNLSENRGKIKTGAISVNAITKPKSPWTGYAHHAIRDKEMF